VPNFVTIGKTLAEMAIFLWWPSTILNFQNQQFLTPSVIRRAQMHYRAKFFQNWSNSCGYMARFRFFFMMAAVRRLGFGSLYHLSKFGWNLFNSGYYMKVSIFCTFGWEMLIHSPKMGFLVNLTP